MRDFTLNKGERRSKRLDIWVQVLQVEDTRKIQQQQEGQTHCKY